MGLKLIKKKNKLKRDQNYKKKNEINRNKSGKNL